jgi:Family of unknown function (DUF6345)
VRLSDFCGNNQPKNKTMKTVQKIIMVGALVLALTTNLFAQTNTNLQFTAVSVTDEHAIRLTWASTNHELYQIQFANALATNTDGTTAWQVLYDNYPSQGTNTFIGDFGNYNVAPQILHPKYGLMRFYRIVDEGADSLASDEPTVSISSPTNSAIVSSELIITVTAATVQPVISGTRLYVDGQEMRMADSTTNWADGSINYETDTYSINTCEWLNGTHILFAVAECESGYASEPNSGAVTSGHGVSPFVSVLFNNLVEGISFSQPTFDPSSGETQQVSAVFPLNSDWTLNIVDVYSNVVQTASGSGTSMLYNWDGTSNGTNLPNGIYYYYITAQTNGEADEIVTNNPGGGGSPPSPDFELMGSPELWTLSANGDDAVPLILYPPGFDTNGFTIFSATPAQVNAARRSVSPTSLSLMGSGFSPDGIGDPGYVTPLPNPQPSPPAPQRPPNNPVRGLAGTFGIAYDTYAANGTNGVGAPPLQNEPGVPGSYIQMESFSANSGLTWPPRRQHTAEANAFIGVMKYYGWSNPLNKTDGQLNISDLRGSGTPFNNVNMGVLMLHGTYGNTQDYMAGLCKQMYFVVTSGGSGQYLRFSEMDLGGTGTNGLKWMVIDACHSLYHVNWSSMKNMGIKPYNSNLHLILGGDTDVWTSPLKWYYFAKYMNYGTSTNAGNYNPLTIRNAYYQANYDAFQKTPPPAGTTITLAVAGDSACVDDSLQTNSLPSGSWTYDSKEIYPLLQ